MKETKIKEEFIQLRAKGFSYDRISKEVDVSKPTLLKWSAEFSEEITEAKILELDALLEQFELAKVERVKALAKLMKKIGQELEKRDLSDVKIDKLVEMAQSLRVEIFNEVNKVGRVFKFGDDSPLQIFDVKQVRVTAID